MRLTLLVALAALSCQSPSSIRPDAVDDHSVQGQSAAQGMYKQGTRLKVRYFVGIDGSEQPVGFFDTVRRENCVFRLAADGVERCLPDSTQRSPFSMSRTYFSDAACTQEVIDVAAGCHVAYTSKSVGNGSACAYGEHVFPIGARVTGQLYELNALGTQRCTAAVALSTVTQHDYYLVGAEVPSSSFQGATEVVR